MKTVITGGHGFVGKHLTTELKSRGLEAIVPPRDLFDFREYEDCLDAFKACDAVIHLAADVGGIGYNQQNPGSIFLNNALMAINTLHAAHESKVVKYVGMGTICAYPRDTPVPFKEEDLWKGYPEGTNAPYGLAKKNGLVMGQAYRDQYGFNAIYLLPTNMYGPGDNFDPESSHVIPALIVKVANAIKNGEDFIEVWGDGSATRDFLYVKDAARGIADAFVFYNGRDPVNLGSGKEISIKELVNASLHSCTSL